MTKLYKILVGTKVGTNEKLFYEVIHYFTEHDDVLTTQEVKPKWKSKTKVYFTLTEAERLTKRKKLRNKFHSVEFVEVIQTEKSKTQHELKIASEFFEAVKDGRKKFEIRKNDRNYQEGDVLMLLEYDKYYEAFTGEKITVEIIYMTDYAQQDGYVVLGIEEIWEG